MALQIEISEEIYKQTMDKDPSQTKENNEKNEKNN